MSSSPAEQPAIPARAAVENRPLVVSDRAEVIDDLVRLAAAAGVTVEVCPDLSAARRSWARAPLVLVDDAVVGSAEVVAVPRRDTGVVLVGRDLDDPSVWRHGVRIGAEHVVILPDAEAWLVGVLGDARDGADAAAGRLVCVVGGSGGSGASTLAATFAATAVRAGTRATLVDLDPWGGGIDLVLGGEDVPGLRWEQLSRASGRLNGHGLRDALPQVDGLPVLTWDRSDDVAVGFEPVRAVVDAAVKASELLVADLPRSGGDAAAYVCGRATDLLLVVPAQVRAVVAAHRVLSTYRPLLTGRLGLVVRGPSPGGLAAREISDSLDVPLVGELRPEPALAAALDRGDSPARRRRGPLVELCRDLVQDGQGRPAGPGARLDLGARRDRGEA